VQIICQGGEIECRYNFSPDNVIKAFEQHMRGRLGQAYRSPSSEDAMGLALRIVQ
jgi:hypothetical protein